MIGPLFWSIYLHIQIPNPCWQTTVWCKHGFSDRDRILMKNLYVFTALHAMQTRSSDEDSVRLSVKRVICDKMEERSVQIFVPYERSFSLVFWGEEWLVGATTSTINFWSTGPRWSEITDFEPIFARSASAVIPSEKSSIITLIGSPLYALSNEPKINIVRCPYKTPRGGGSKTQSVQNLNITLR